MVVKLAIKMASGGGHQDLIEEKKKALLRRIEEKRKAALQQTSAGASPSSNQTTGTSSTPMPSNTMFTNDGNFFERFQAMQQQQQASKSRPLVSMKLTTVKKAAPARPPPTRLDVFEKPDSDEESNGNFLFDFSEVLHLIQISVSWFLFAMIVVFKNIELLRYVSDGRCN